MISTCFSINEVASPEACLISKISNMSGWLIKKSGFASKYSRTSESDIFFEDTHRFILIPFSMYLASPIKLNHSSSRLTSTFSFPF